MKTRSFVYLLLFVVTVISGCQTQVKKDTKPAYDAPLMDGESALYKIVNPTSIPDFTAASTDVSELVPAIDRSLNYLSKPSSKQFYPVSGITHQRAVSSLLAFKKLLVSGVTGAQLNAAINQRFDVYSSIGYDNRGTVLFTGYYSPVFDGSLKKEGKFNYPLYKLPKDLVKGKDGTILGRKYADGKVRPYPSRMVIEQAEMLKGQELVWLGDPFEAYVAHVQGSTKVKLPDGKMITIGYAGNNGREYKGIVKAMVAEGKIDSEKISLAAMIDYFDKHPEDIARFTQSNPRFVFFQIEEGMPRGSLNEIVTPMRSVATDKSIFPRGCLVFIKTHLPAVGGGLRKYSGFALDQDTGGAIRAPGRCDIYFGIGDKAGETAGKVYEEGRLYYLFLK